MTIQQETPEAAAVNGATSAAAPARTATLEQQARQLADGQISSVDLVERALNAIDQTQGDINAFRAVRHEAARAEAAEADRRLAAGERLPLLGVPVCVKDDIHVAGESTEIGAPGNFPVQTEDCAMVTRLRDAGAVIVGKTTCPELAMWPVQDSKATDTTRNPWNLEHTPGGSSGGVAAAVAAGIVAGGIGSDGAGSVRIPAAWNHLVGIKPQNGRISTWPNPDMVNGLTVLGPLARTVRDAALLLDVTTGSEAGDLDRPAPPAESYLSASERDPGRLRIGLSFDHAFSGFPSQMHHEVRMQTKRLGDVLREAGHEVVDVSMPYGLLFGATFMPRSMGGLKSVADELVPDHSLLDPRTRTNLRTGTALGGPILRWARRQEPRLRRRMGRLFERVDVVIAPTTARPPLPARALRGLSASKTDSVIINACPMTWPWNVLGWPGVNVPAGFTSDGLPIGVQLLGSDSTESTLISLAAQLEAVEQWQQHWPPHAVAI